MAKKQIKSYLLARIRGGIQLLATLLSNLHLPNFLKGTIFQGSTKQVCVPGLNCYSCPGAAGACPIGAMQAVVGSSKFKFSYYITGMLIFIGVLLGRFVCGFLCPFGWFQDLLHKIPTKKFSTKKLSGLRYLKYLILVVMVFLLPAFVVNVVGMGNPFFCKYLCPQGVLEGAIPLSLASTSICSALGSLFAWKSCVLAAVIILSILFYRPFCKWICPLGAFYAWFNRISLLQLQVDQNKCISCGKCGRACKMDVAVPQTPNHNECIRCGACITACPTQAIHYQYGCKKQKRILLFAVSLILVLGFTACGKAKQSAEELIQQENEIIAEHQDLWDLAFNAVDKDTVGSQTGDYADFLKMALENIKDRLSKEDFKALSEDVKKIKALEEQLAALPQEDSNPTGTSLDSAKSFPAFTGKDFDGNAVDESLFTNNSVTLVNFWFNGCSPCVGELPALQELHDSLQEKGGAVVGINVETLDENEDTIAAAKEIMKKQGASYQNIYFDSDSEAGKLALSVMSFPTSVLIDSEGNIVGDVIVGGLDNEKTMASVQKQIDEILAK